MYLFYQDFNKVSHNMLLDRVERNVQLGRYAITKFQCHSKLINRSGHLTRTEPGTVPNVEDKHESNVVPASIYISMCWHGWS